MIVYHRRKITAALFVKHSTERTKKMWAMYQEHSLQEVGDHFKLSKERVRQILEEAGHSTRDTGPRPKKLTSWEREIALIYDRGELSPSEIQMKFDISYYRLRTILKRANIDLKPRGYFIARTRKDSALYDKVVKDYKAGMKAKYIAEKFNLKASTKVYYILAKKGVKPDRRSKDINEEKVIKDYKNNIPLLKIASRNNLSTTGQIYSILERNGIAANRRKTTRSVSTETV